MPAQYYNKILYPLQDKTTPLFQNTPFYLTGGTALSRGYYNHRYSDDLDYFVNYLPDFKMLLQVQIDKMQKTFSDVTVDMKGEYFCRVFVGKEKLKIEMINDVPSHIGKLVNHPVLGVIDSKENILANKITALMDRALPKDIVDVFFLIKDGVSIKRALTDAESKAAGISPLFIAKILAEFDYSLMESEVKWVSPVPGKEIKDFLTGLSMAIVQGKI